MQIALHITFHVTFVLFYKTVELAWGNWSCYIFRLCSSKSARIKIR